MEASTPRKVKPYKGVAMEGVIATWYAKNTASSLAEFVDLAKRIAAETPAGAAVLEIAPGPGYLAIELARLGARRIAGLDISHSFVRIASQNAARAGVDIDFRQGDAAALPFGAAAFDFIVSRAAFKNFGDPVGALREMHRVLRPGGTAVIFDMRGDATNASIAKEVAKMRLGRASAFFTDAALRSLKKRAYSREDFVGMIAATPFGAGQIAEEPIGFEVRLTKAPGAAH
ncbi:MAG: class I SAM-dependent methyltransferase [Caulobacterales bacterium]